MNNNHLRILGDIPELPVITDRNPGINYNQWKQEIKVNKHGFRTIEFDEIDYTKPRFLTFGCSHTWGTANEQKDTWPEKLAVRLDMQLINLGQPSASADYVHRIFPFAIKKFTPEIVFIYWPHWTRFEYMQDGKIYQSCPSDSDRIYHMETATDEWLRKNFAEKVEQIVQWCKDQSIRLVHLSDSNLIPYMDHADRWPLAVDKSHFAPEWNQRLADIYYNLYITNTQPEITYGQT